MLKKLILFISTICFLCACETDFDVHADWKDHTIVYSLLNPSDSIHYVKVYKAFLGPDNALTMAQEPDSIYYTSNEIEVVLINLNTEMEYILRDTILNDADTGTFIHTPNEAFYFVGDINDSHRYRLEVRKQNDDLVFAETDIVENSLIDNDLTDVFSVVRPDGSDIDENIKFNLLNNAYYYEVDLEFHYKEWNINNTSDTISKYIYWRINDVKNPISNNIEVTVETIDFFQKIKTRIPVDSNLVRQPKYVMINYSVSEKQLYNYLKINQEAVNSLLFELPMYNNLSGSGTGIFSSRRFEQSQKTISPYTIDRLEVDSHTVELNFIP
ncbi:MAG: hypothetical protein CMP75_03400 [Flavobacteriales bacterium]|nr:hypothetical protein [Flavobacteriales bacterium]|tara:strand:+ start:432 stop:1412 length:981 start_codon:yes stop_codon:yes gene_type:complete